jgi:hypothetical protein
VTVSPEEIGLCGCWQILAIERMVIESSKPSAPPTCEIAYYVTSRTREEMTPQELLDATIGHWEGIENGTHYVRDVSFGEDACQISKPTAARNMVTLRNFAIGLHCLQKLRGKTKAPSLPSWRRSMKASQALRHLLR